MRCEYTMRPRNCAMLQFEVEAGDLAAVRALEARRRDALSEPPPYDNAHTLLLKYRYDPNKTLSVQALCQRTCCSGRAQIMRTCWC